MKYDAVILVAVLFLADTVFIRTTYRNCRPNKTGLKCLFVLSYIHTYVHTSVRKTLFSISMKFGM